MVLPFLLAIALLLRVSGAERVGVAALGRMTPLILSEEGEVLETDARRGAVAAGRMKLFLFLPLPRDGGGEGVRARTGE